MSRFWITGLISVIAAAWFALPANSAEVGTANTVVRDVYGRNLAKRMRSGDGLQFKQPVRVGRQSAAGLLFADKSRLSLGPNSEVVIDEFVYNPNRNFAQGSLNLVRGVMRFASRLGKRRLTIKTPVGSIGIRGTIFDVLANSRSMEVTVHEGEVEVAGRRGRRKVKAGESLTMNSVGQTSMAKAPSAQMAKAVASMISLLASAGDTEAGNVGAKAQTKSASKSAARAMPANLAGKDPDSILVIELAYGPVYIEMLPTLAPKHCARMAALASSGFFDGQAFFNVKQGFVAQAGDPTGTGRGGSGKTLKAEFSKSPFTRGSVGMMRRRNDVNSADSQFFVAFGDLTHLNGKYTKWGQIISGMAHLDRLQQGNPPKTPDRIIRMRSLAEVLAASKS